MGRLTVLPVETYQGALRKLFPEGPFWDEQFADPTSDISLWCEAKAQEVHRFKTRRAELLEEGFPGTATELIENWERGVEINNSALTLAQRRQALESISLGSIKGSQLVDACAIFGATLDQVKFPFTPALFGRTRFRSRLATAAALSAIWLYITLPDMAHRAELENHLTSILLANHLVTFLYKDGSNEYVP